MWPQIRWLWRVLVIVLQSRWRWLHQSSRSNSIWRLFWATVGVGRLEGCERNIYPCMLENGHRILWCHFRIVRVIGDLLWGDQLTSEFKIQERRNWKKIKRGSKPRTNFSNLCGGGRLENWNTTWILESLTSIPRRRISDNYGLWFLRCETVKTRKLSKHG